MGYRVYMLRILTVAHLADCVLRCVLGEMFTHRPILPGASDLDQLEKIWQLCGTPNERTWPSWDQLPGCEGVRTWNIYNRQIRLRFDQYHQ